MAADSTMLRIVNLFIALSFGVHLEQLEQRIGLTWPRPFLLRPLPAHYQHSTPGLAVEWTKSGVSYLDARFLTMVTIYD